MGYCRCKRTSPMVERLVVFRLTLWDRDPSSNRHWPVGSRQDQYLFKLASSLFSPAANSFHTHHLSTPTAFPHPLQPSTMSDQQTISNYIWELNILSNIVTNERCDANSRASLKVLHDTLIAAEVPFFLPCEGKNLTHAYPAQN